MTAAYRVTVAERQDLLCPTVICPECSAELTVKIDTAKIPEHCACCSRPLEQNTIAALSALARFHREAQVTEQQTGKPMPAMDQLRLRWASTYPHVQLRRNIAPRAIMASVRKILNRSTMCAGFMAHHYPSPGLAQNTENRQHRAGHKSSVCAIISR